MKIDHIQVGRRNLQSAAQKINDAIDITESVSNMVGDKFIKIEQTSSSTNIGLKINEVLKLVPERSVSGGGGGTEIRRAKLTADAGSGNTITANLYDSAGVEQTTGEYAGVTVYCNVTDDSTGLNECIPRLVSGKEIMVTQLPYDNSGTIEQRWYCTAIFQPIAAPLFIDDGKLGLNTDSSMFEIASDKLSDKLYSCE